MPLSRTWVKSSYSDPNGGNCLEARQLSRGAVQVRDSKESGRDRTVITFTGAAWQDLIAKVKNT